ncbi:MAG: AMP-binding protein [Desulfobacteraceae bacterium]|uniref:AMP-binding protein n=1 Tax=Candidatus Desulfacyla euxinica TaxID=2841693 RepID=A0A8J6T9T8_9DELT|nr:AMP-binding protein [Candidatus Desulfacyla euxinica]MBL6977902.1 AMP-binding protein [Desulfobacteraceae bacterium]
MDSVETTFPKLLMENTRQYGNRVAMREKYKGIWQEISWETYLDKVKTLSLGLLEMGLKGGDHASILAENCPEWLYADLAIQAVRAVSVGIYPTNSPDQVQYILDHSQSRIVFVKDQEQADKVLEIKGQLPLLMKMVVMDMKGLRHYDDSLIVSYQDVEDLGRKAEERDSEAFDEMVLQTDPEDVAFIVYTSGTTGPPKGAMISHKSDIHMIVKGLQPILHFSDKDFLLSYLPLCHIMERNLSMCMPLVFGYTINFAESIETVPQNIQEISPSFFAAVPRILEKLHSAVKIKMEDSTRFKRFVFRLWEPVGIEVAEYRMKDQRPPLAWLFLYALAYLFSFRPVRDKMGLLGCRCVMSGGAPIAPEVLAFFRSLGVHTVEMYGLTETCGTVAGPHRVVKHGSVGEPCGALEFHLSEDGEILLKGDSVFTGYYRDPEATREMIRDGWLQTGDIGKLDEDGHLYIVDRKKDIIITSGGKNISPSEIENKMKCSPYVKEAIIIGDARKYLTSLLQIDYDNVGNWAQNNKIPYTTYRNLAQNPAVYELIKKEIEGVNETLARVETIKKFRILEKELDQDDEELTATQKVKRRVIEKRFKEEIAQMYGAR